MLTYYTPLDALSVCIRVCRIIICGNEPDGCFPGFKMYWKGGAAAFTTFITSFVGGHASLVPFLNNTRDKNPACKLPRTAAQPHGTPPAAAKAPRAVDARSDSAEDMVSLYDAKGAHRQCSYGPRAYIENCALPSDYFSYILSAAPTVSSMNCEDLGFEYVMVDNVFHGFKL